MKTPPKIRALPTLEQLALSFPKKRVLVVGDFVADHYIYGQTERVSREAPVLIVRYENSDVKLGGGANAAANARSMGGQVTSTVSPAGRRNTPLLARKSRNRSRSSCARRSER